MPSTVVLVGDGTLIGMGKLPFWPVFVASSLGAFVGDLVSYWVGRIYKHQLTASWPFSRYRPLIVGGEHFFKRHGGKSAFLGRFVPGIKSVVPGIAGMMGMNAIRFSAINALSALAWSAAHLLPAMGVGRSVSIVGTGDPRFVTLGVLLLAGGFLAWYSARLTVAGLGPLVARLYRASLRSWHCLLGAGWRSLPQNRIELDGETGEPFIVQTDLSAQQVAVLLGASGWQKFPPPTLAQEIAAFMPTAGDFAAQTPLPTLHDGGTAVLSLDSLPGGDAVVKDEAVLTNW